MKFIPSPHIHKNNQCLQYSEQELLPDFNQQDYAMKWIALQLALLSYVTAVGYSYKNRKATTTITAISFGIASFLTAIIAAPKDDHWDNLILLFLFKELLPETLENCKNYAEEALFFSFYVETFYLAASVATLTTVASTYYLASNFFTKNAVTTDKREPRQTQLEVSCTPSKNIMQREEDFSSNSELKLKIM